MTDAPATQQQSVSADTSVLLRATLQEDGLEAQSLQARMILISGRHDVVICDVAIAEYVHVLEAHYHIDRATICDMVLAIVRLSHVHCSDHIIIGALAHFASKPKLSFDDCFIAEYARDRHAIPLWTFDKKLAKQHDIASLVTTSPKG